MIDPAQARTQFVVRQKLDDWEEDLALEMLGRDTLISYLMEVRKSTLLCSFIEQGKESFSPIIEYKGGITPIPQKGLIGSTGTLESWKDCYLNRGSVTLMSTLTCLMVPSRTGCQSLGATTLRMFKHFLGNEEWHYISKAMIKLDFACNVFRIATVIRCIAFQN